ncbi:MAG: hypothetical protein KAU27_14315 [Desulfuromonadales bacterium]|nr:hypothetical protein [Desulfuromonadales bacterium]
MEDLWRVQDSGVEVEDFSSVAEYKCFLERFSNDEEQDNYRSLLFEDETFVKPEVTSEP